MPSKLRDAIQEEARRLGGLDDAADAVRTVGDLFAQLDFELEVLAEVRLHAVQRLRRDGWTYARIAEATGLSEPRVAQLARAGGVGGRVAARND